MQKPPTVSQILRAYETPVYDVSQDRKTGDVIVDVTGVPQPFRFTISAAVVKDAAPFGRPTRGSIMRLAQDLARTEMRERGFKV